MKDLEDLHNDSLRLRAMLAQVSGLLDDLERNLAVLRDEELEDTTMEVIS